MKLGHVVTAPIAGFVALLTVVATQGMTGRESGVALFLGYTIIWLGIFGFAASLPHLFADARETALNAFVAFGLGGAVSGGLVGYLTATHRLGGSPTAVKVGLLIPFVLPWVLGMAVFLGRRIRA